MKRWWEKYQARKVRQKQVALQRWGKERLEGQARFVLRNTVFISMSYLTVSEIFGKDVGLSTIIFWHVVGFATGLYQWMDKETKYQLARGNGQLPAAPVKPQINADLI